MRAHDHRPTRPTPHPAPQVVPDEARETPAAISTDFSQVPARSAGTPLPSEVRRRLEDRWGEDLSGVRVHTGPEAAQSARDLDAVAYTSGEDIVVAGAPDEHLLTHEAAHVVQQRHASRLVPGVSSPGDAAERAADAGLVAVPGGPVAAVQRQVDRRGEKPGVPVGKVEKALTEYLTEIQRVQGGQTLHNTDEVKSAILKLFVGDAMKMASVEAWLSGPVSGTPAALAHEVAKKLPPVVPENRVAHLGIAPAKADPDKRPKNAGEAVGAVIVDSTLTPILRRIGLSDGLRKLVVDGAKSAVASGVLKLVDVAMDQAHLKPEEQGSIHSLVEGWINQQPGKAMERQQEGAGSPYAQVVPPSVAPPVPSAPGEKIIPGPSVPFDFSPSRDAPKPNLKQAGPSEAVLAAARQFDPLLLTPPEVRGTERAGDYLLAGEFAVNAAKLLDDAQKNNRSSAVMSLPVSYRLVKDRPAMFEAIRTIFFAMRAALPYRTRGVSQVVLMVEGHQFYRFELP
ncbi:DUF4157 domain-containing protein [Amycolatopsis sp. NPDC004079]|uniref:eCIS core domain-containing protein n=1 Tax=Amycolatopsis sp. NPDC004079 TaxID=3154549 RepID=UPI0033A41B8C